MALWTSLAVLSIAVSTTLSFPDKAYNIPNVGTGRRSQYYVLHDDGTFKYGYDTGDGAYETSRLHHAGRQDGQFGYQDPDGNTVNLRYEAGEGGFRPVGNRIPQPHPDFVSAHEAARSRPPFSDPLASSNTDASYKFGFSGEASGRQEESDSEGNVRGSYSYTDDDGVTRSFSYTAGRGTGFVVQGDDLPREPLGGTPAATALVGGTTRGTIGAFRGTTGAFRGTKNTETAFRGTTTAHRGTTTAHRGTSHLGTAFRGTQSSQGGTKTAHRGTTTAQRGTTHLGTTFGGTTHSHLGTAQRGTTHSHSGTTHSHTSFGAPSHSHRGTTFGGATRTAQTTHGSAHTTHSRPSTRFTSSTRFEPANTQSQVTSDGGYTFAYRTSDQSHYETGDSQGNVDGGFEFEADDGETKRVSYEAGTDTGFIAEGSHIPVGPVVPGAPSGQPTGRIVPVASTRFVDPLADSDTDASYSFKFNSEQYSRSESADSDGNVQGEYTVIDDDGTKTLYQYRAGEGIGFETRPVSVSRGARPRKPASVSAATGTNFGAVSAHNRVSSQNQQFSSQNQRVSSVSSQNQGVSTHASSHSSHSSHSKPSVISYKTPTHSSTHSTHSTHSRFGSGALRGGSTFSGASLGAKEVFPGFKLNQYGAEENRGKFGYVLTFE